MEKKLQWRGIDALGLFQSVWFEHLNDSGNLLKPSVIVLEMLSRISGRLLLWITLLAGIFVLVTSKGCTRSTCPPGPVRATFEFSNCTGNVVFQTLRFNYGECSNQTGSSTLTSYDDKAIEVVRFAGSENCKAGEVNPTRTGERYYFGTCTPTVPDSARGARAADSGATMILASVNASYISPQVPQGEVDLNVPLYAPAVVECYGYENCSAQGQFFTGFYQSATCSLEGALYTVDTNVAPNRCYRSSSSPDAHYQTVGCVNGHTKVTTVYLTSDCSRPYTAYLEGLECPTSGWVNHFCLAPPLAPPTAEMTSAASFTTRATIVTVLAIFGLLIFL